MGMETPKTLPKGCVGALRLPKRLRAYCHWSVASTIQLKLRLLMPNAVELKVPRFFIYFLIPLGRMPQSILPPKAAIDSDREPLVAPEL